MPLIVGGLWSEWADRETGEIFKTVSIVKQQSNRSMARIHNNPKASQRPRMPVILPPENKTNG